MRHHSCSNHYKYVSMAHMEEQRASSNDRIAVVTGGGRGIGKGIALRLAADGYVVGIHYGSNEDAAAAAVKEIQEADGRAFAFRTELSEPDAGEEFWRQYEAAARSAGFADLPLHALVNNAAVVLRGTIEDTSREGFRNQQAINVDAPYFIVREGLGRLRDGGRIVNLSSGATRVALPEIISYSLTKGAIDAFTLTLAKHLGSRGITVNAVAPGIIDTDMNASWLRGNQEAIDGLASMTALGRLGRPEDVAGVVAFLVSEDAGLVTGQVIDATAGHL